MILGTLCLMQLTLLPNLKYGLFEFDVYNTHCVSHYIIHDSESVIIHSKAIKEIANIYSHIININNMTLSLLFLSLWQFPSVEFLHTILFLPLLLLLLSSRIYLQCIGTFLVNQN